jgi:hypothetical protein
MCITGKKAGMQGSEEEWKYRRKRRNKRNKRGK